MILKIQGSAIDVVINHQGARDKLINTISKINKEQIGQLLSSIGDEIEKGYTKYTSNPCMISYSSGQGIFVVVSLFVGAGQANGARTFLQTLEKLDVAGQLIGKVFRVGGKFLKPILNPISKKIKFALAEGVQFAQRIEFKLPNNLYCGIPYLEIKLRDRLKTLTANEIKKLEDDIARQLNDPNIPVDENGNKLLELDIDGEKVPAVVGTNEGLDKIDDGVSLQGAGKAGLLSKLASHPNISSLVSRLDDVADAGLISKLDDYATNNPTKLTQLNDLYNPSTFSLPADRPFLNGTSGAKVGGDFNVTKVIDGQNISVYYNKAGYPNLNQFSAGSDYNYVSNALKGLGGDMTLANNAMKQKFLSFPDKFKWNGSTSWFEIKDVNGNWVKYTWHHYQDGRKMFPVPSKIHNATEGGFNHTGGKAVITKGLQDLFD